MSLRLALLAAGLATMASAAPAPQQLNLAAILAQGPPATPTIASTAGVIKLAATSLARAAAAEISVAPLPQTTAPAALLEKRDGSVPQSNLSSPACQARPAQQVGAGPVPSDDSDSGFLAFGPFASAANGAATPSGYSLAFQNLQSESSAYGYMGYNLLNSYSPATCASQCDSISGCQGINIAFERAPVVDPGTNCTNPPSTTLIKCIFWGSPNGAPTATNSGSWRGNDFHVVMAGSNGYLKLDPVGQQTSPGYTRLSSPTNATINAPTYDANGVYSYMGYKSWNDGAPFSVARCGAACTAQSVYNLANPPQNGNATTCQFFATYFLMKNGLVQSQVCAMYTESWTSQYATGTGYYYGSDVYSIASAVIYANSTDPEYGVAPSS